LNWNWPPHGINRDFPALSLSAASLHLMTIWTPSGEHEIPRNSSDSPDQSKQVKSGGQAAEPVGSGPDGEIDPEVQQQYEEQLAEISQRILETPIETMLAQHFVGLFEIAAIHLSADSPNLHNARLVINAMDGMMSATEGELGNAEEPMQSMLHQIRMAFVSVSKGSQAVKDDPPPQDSAG